MKLVVKRPYSDYKVGDIVEVPDGARYSRANLDPVPDQPVPADPATPAEEAK